MTYFEVALLLIGFVVVIYGLHRLVKGGSSDGKD